MNLLESCCQCHLAPGKKVGTDAHPPKTGRAAKIEKELFCGSWGMIAAKRGKGGKTRFRKGGETSTKEDSTGSLKQ